MTVDNRTVIIEAVALAAIAVNLPGVNARHPEFAGLRTALSAAVAASPNGYAASQELDRLLAVLTPSPDAISALGRLIDQIGAENISSIVDQSRSLFTQAAPSGPNRFNVNNGAANGVANSTTNTGPVENNNTNFESSFIQNNNGEKIVSQIAEKIDSTVNIY